MVYAQEDSLLLKRLTRPVVTCELIATNCQQIISTLTIDKLDSIRFFLEQWKKYCGESEPVKRAEILISIYDGTYTDSINTEYFFSTVKKFDNRVRFSRNKDYQIQYENNKTYFDYTPLNGSFDLWTLTLARSLIQSQERNSSQYLFCMIFCDSITSAEKLIRTKAFSKNYLG